MVGLRRTLLRALCLSVSLAVASCAQEASQVAEAPQVVEAPQVAEAPQAIEAPQVVEAPQSVAELSPARSLGLTVETLPNVDSSTSAQPLAMTIICEAVGVDAEWKRWGRLEQRLVPTSSEGITVQGHIVKVRDSGKLDIRHYPPKVRTSGTNGAWTRLIKGEADVIFVARKPSADELALALEHKVKLDYRPVALDAFVFIVNDLNPVENLTIEQIQDIYTGKVTLWTELGRKPAREIAPLVEYIKSSRPNMNDVQWDVYFTKGTEADQITAYQRNKNSGSQQLMLSLVMKDLEMITPPSRMMSSGMAGPFDRLSRDHSGLAYTVYFYEKNMVVPRSKANMRTGATLSREGSSGEPDPRLRDHKVIAVNGIVPNARTISSREYPFTTEVYVAIRADTPEDHTARKLRDFVLTPEGQKLVAKSGYVPYTPLAD